MKLTKKEELLILDALVYSFDQMIYPEKRKKAYFKLYQKLGKEWV